MNSIPIYAEVDPGNEKGNTLTKAGDVLLDREREF